MGKIIKKVMNVVAKVMPILQIASFVFPVIAPFTAMLTTVFNSINAARSMIQGGFPKGLIQGALQVAGNFLPGPVAKVTEFAQGKLDAVKALIPAAVKNVVPAAKMPVAAGIGNWI
ncbi:hypothetical protein D3C72_362430 [compost metagenome]